MSLLPPVLAWAGCCLRRMTSLSGCRYEDNGDAVNNINVMVRSTTKNSIEEFGDPAKFLEENQYLLGKQTFLGRLLHVPLQLY